ncbi:FG-GAP repeat domain-containing protein, partial [Salinispora pacifica]|uniref:FG-GAP repeat domain-containing protein n=1 Tax=Salinispora pacifica TaxID=351187 RepID=UPI001EE299AE
MSDLGESKFATQGAVDPGFQIQGSAIATPETPVFGPDIDNYASHDPQDTCDPSMKPGTVALRSILNEAYGVHTGYIGRACDVGGTSEHKEGRALDYMLNVNNSADNAAADSILNWMLATDQHGNKHANARRLGIMYIIWDRHIWSASRADEGWRSYSGPSPHTDHIHFSQSWAGATKQTTWWTANPEPPTEPDRWVADVTGDGYHDLVAREDDGTLMLYSNNIVRDNGVPYSTPSSRQIGQGWDAFDTVVNADVTGDGYTDLVARKPDGTLWLYSNNIVRDNGVPYSYASSRQIGQGWNAFDTIIGADVTGDGYTDLVARKPDGTLWLYSNNIVRDNGVP